MMFLTVLAVLPILALAQLGGYRDADVNSPNVQSVLDEVEPFLNAHLKNKIDNYYKVANVAKVETQRVNGDNYRFTGLELRETVCDKSVKDISICILKKPGKAFICKVVVYKPLKGESTIKHNCRDMNEVVDNMNETHKG